MKPTDAPLNHRIVICSALAIAVMCAIATYIIASIAPRPKKPIPFTLELWMGFGWVTGLYLSVSATTFRHLVWRYLPSRVARYCDVAHALQIPIVIGGVGTFVVMRLLGHI